MRSIKELLDNLKIINISNVKKLLEEIEYENYNDYLDKIYRVYACICYQQHYEIINTIAQKVLDIIDKVEEVAALAKGYAIIVSFGTLNGLPEKAVEYGLKFEEIKNSLDDDSPYSIPIYSSMAVVFYKNRFFQEAIEYTEKIINEPKLDSMPESIKISQYINYLAMSPYLKSKKLFDKVMKRLNDYFKKDKSEEAQSLKFIYDITYLQIRNQKATEEDDVNELEKIMVEFENISNHSIKNIDRLVEQQDSYIDILKTFFRFKKYQFIIEKCNTIINTKGISNEDLMEVYRLLIASLEEMAGEASPRIVKSYNEILYSYYEAQTFLKQQMIEKSVELYHLEKKIETVIRKDTLTNCYNRRYINEFMTLNKDKIKTFIFCDIDNFKITNDKYGHKIGDMFLIALVEAFNDFMPKQSALFRFGGDEFVLASSLTTIKENEALIKRIKERTKEIISNTEYDYVMDFSYGIYPIKDLNEDIFISIDHADELMYKNKENKKNLAKKEL